MINDGSMNFSVFRVYLHGLLAGYAVVFLLFHERILSELVIVCASIPYVHMTTYFVILCFI